jgi:hypothetical protein
MRDYFEQFSLDMITRPSAGETAPDPMRPLPVRETGQRLNVIE